MSNKEYILKANERMIDAYLIGDLKTMQMWKILLDTLIEEEIEKKKQELMKKSFTKEIWETYTIRIPEFIKTTDKVHKSIYDEMCLLNNEFKLLLVDIVLSKAKLSMINKNVDKHKQEIDELLEISKYPITEHLQEYYDCLFEDILQLAIEQEEFEIAQNIKNYQLTYGV